MIDLFRKYNKLFAVFLSTILFLVAISYTLLFGLNKDVKIKVNERQTSGQAAEVSTIENANLNQTVGELLEENQYPTDDNYIYETDLDTKVSQVDTIVINKKVNGSVAVDGNNINYSSGAETVNDLLDEMDIKLSTLDTVEPTRETLLTSDLSNIVVHRQSIEREKREEAISYPVDQKQDSNLAEGKVEVDIPGIEGKRFVTEDVKYMDGVPVERNKVEEVTLVEPITQVVRVGTGKTSDSKVTMPDVTKYNTNTTPTGQTPAASSATPSTASANQAVTKLGYNGTTLNQEDFDLVCAIVEHEGGNDYTSALAVMSCVMNRVDSPAYPNDPVSVLTAPGQFASYLGGYYKQYLGNSSSQVRQAVKDCLNGSRNHNYLSFRSYQTSNSEKIGGNWFFNE